MYLLYQHHLLGIEQMQAGRIINEPKLRLQELEEQEILFSNLKKIGKTDS